MPVPGPRFLDLSGYSFTGKAAVIDLMREVRGCSVPSSEFEFALLRCKDGILDLEHALVDDWSPIRSAEAIRRFHNLIHVYGGDGGPWARLTRIGHHYDRAFPGFTARSLAYLESLVSESWRGEWEFATHWQPAFEVALRKVAFKAGWRGAAMYDIYLSAPSPATFMERTRSYLAGVLGSAAAEQDDLVVTHNAFEPFDPSRSMRFFEDARVVVVDRDPRDVYVSAARYIGSDGRKGWSSATTGGAQGFVEQYRTFRSRVKRERDDARVLRINFETLVLDYENSVARILAFIGKTASDHVRPKQHFDPSRSAAGVGGWRDFPDQKAISFIKERLPEFCVG